MCTDRGPKTGNPVQEPVIMVLSKYGVHISDCTKKRAHQLIKRQAADWAGYNIIQLRYDRHDKKRFKEEAMERDHYTCYICGKVMHKDHPDITVDHIVPMAQGGTDYPENLACSCIDCNEEKKAMGLGQFLNKKLCSKTVGRRKRRNGVGSKHKQAAVHSDR